MRQVDCSSEQNQREKLIELEKAAEKSYNIAALWKQ